MHIRQFRIKQAGPEENGPIFCHLFYAALGHTVSVTATDEEENEYTGTIVVQVLDRDQLDALLQGKWDAMKAGMAAGDIPASVELFSDDTQSLYEEICTAFYDRLPSIAAAMQPIKLVSVEDNVAKYRIRKNEIYNGDSLTVTYYIYFVQDDLGVWKIHRF